MAVVGTKIHQTAEGMRKLYDRMLEAARRKDAVFMEGKPNEESKP